MGNEGPATEVRLDGANLIHHPPPPDRPIPHQTLMTSGSAVAIDPIRWAKAMPLLSLDLLLLIYPAMGLTPRDPLNLQRTVRDQIIRARREFGVGQSKASAVTDIASNTLAALDADDALHLAHWIGRVFHADSGDSPALRAWSTLMRHCRRQPKLWDELCSDMRRGKEVLDAFERSINIDAFEAHYTELSNAPLSEWDLHVYAIHVFDDDDSEGAPTGPHLWIAPTVRDFQGYRFWSWMGQTFSSEDLIQLRLRAESIKRREAVPPEGTMPEPNVLVGNS